MEKAFLPTPNLVHSSWITCIGNSEGIVVKDSVSPDWSDSLHIYIPSPWRLYP